MLTSKPIPRKTAQLIQALQREKDHAQSQLDIAVAAVLSVVELDGVVVSVDSENCVLNVEVPE